MTDTAKTGKPTDALASSGKDDGTHTFTLDGREVTAKNTVSTDSSQKTTCSPADAVTIVDASIRPPAPCSTA